MIQGDWAPPRFVVVEFESVEQAHGWLNSEGYADLLDIRDRSSDTSIIVMEGFSG